MPDLSTAALLTELHNNLNGKVEAPHEVGLLLIAHVLNKPKTWIIAYPGHELTPEEVSQVKLLTRRLIEGEPLPYITGLQEFYGLSFNVNEHVLIPRPETELLVDEALAWLDKNLKSTFGIDVGTGSGCIAITLASINKTTHFIASDISQKALLTAKSNAFAQQVDNRINFVQADLLSTFRCQFDLIYANLPYIPTHKLEEVNTLGFEPIEALDGGKDGLRFIRLLLLQAQYCIKSPGLILLEIEASTGLASFNLAKNLFPCAKVSLIKDFSEHDRLIKIQVGTLDD